MFILSWIARFFLERALKHQERTWAKLTQALMKAHHAPIYQAGSAFRARGITFKIGSLANHDQAKTGQCLMYYRKRTQTLTLRDPVNYAMGAFATLLFGCFMLHAKTAQYMLNTNVRLDESDVEYNERYYNNIVWMFYHQAMDAFFPESYCAQFRQKVPASLWENALWKVLGLNPQVPAHVIVYHGALARLNHAAEPFVIREVLDQCLKSVSTTP